MQHYTPQHFSFTTEQRAAMRDKIVQAITAGIAEEYGLTREVIFNTFTQKGGLHGLNRNEFENFARYSDAKKALEDGQFFTPPDVCEQIMTAIQPDASQRIADLTCGMGNFFNACPVLSNCYGIELDVHAATVATYLYPDATIQTGDLRYLSALPRLDIVVGNPPFNLSWTWTEHDRRKQVSSQLFYLLKAAEVLRPGGLCVIIVPAAFLSDEFQEQAAITAVNDRFSFLGASLLQYDVQGFGQIQTKVLALQRCSEHFEHAPLDMTLLSWDTLAAKIQQANNTALTLKSKLTLELRQKDVPDDSYYLIRKLRYHIGQHPRTKHLLAQADALIERYATQQKPEHVSWDEWCKMELTLDSLMKQLKDLLRQQNPRPSQAERIIKTSYGLKWNQHASSIAYAVTHESRPFPLAKPEARGYVRLLAQKHREYDRQMTPFREMEIPHAISTFLTRWRVYDRRDLSCLLGKEIALNSMQRDDLGRFLQKDRALVQWEQGGGKTLALLAWNDWQRQQHPCRWFTPSGSSRPRRQGIHYTVITSSALAIKAMWMPTLTAYGRQWRHIAHARDLQQAQPGEYLLITFDAIARDDTPMLYQALRRWVRTIGERHISWLCDESHNLCNPDSKRTRRTKAALQKVFFKFFATGTTMLNNPAELYPQMEALFNNSANMMNWCPSQFERDGDDMIETANEYYGEPYPAKDGYDVFKRCHCPERVSVFGITTLNQDVYQLPELLKLTDAFILTRTFEEIRGDAMLDVTMLTVSQNPSERALTIQIMEELQGLLHYFNTTGNSRKDAGLRLVRQMMLLIRATSTPHLFKEYQGDALPNKLLRIFALLQSISEPVMLGVMSYAALHTYQQQIETAFPDRHLFLSHGGIPLEERLDVAKRFERSGNGILLATQQSLSESISIPEVNHCIIESLQWNDPKLAQFYSRIRRFDSSQRTRVYFVTYANSIEQNRLGLLLAKRRLTDAVKHGDTGNDQELRERFGVTEDLLEQCLRKAKDEDGKTYLSFGAFEKWGQQTMN